MPCVHAIVASVNFCKRSDIAPPTCGARMPGCQVLPGFLNRALVVIHGNSVIQSLSASQGFRCSLRMPTSSTLRRGRCRGSTFGNAQKMESVEYKLSLSLLPEPPCVCVDNIMCNYKTKHRSCNEPGESRRPGEIEEQGSKTRHEL